MEFTKMTSVKLISDCLHLKFSFGKNSPAKCNGSTTCHKCSGNMFAKVGCLGKCREIRAQEIEAVQACRWLKEAGFPQYAQMYEDGHFPVNIASVEKEHDFLEKESLQPLVRRLNTLNKCAIMRVNTPATKKGVSRSVYSFQAPRGTFYTLS
ncbi:rho GTPase-activating protein 7-like [Argopecten irradians]|uniref:rho GTPase-activating protein 7-like n=1 Tax=Argopecten irradians TaxID=31199 RepID=UPI003721F2A8